MLNNYCRLALLLLFGSSAVNADIYKCVVNGHTEFSDNPCTSTAEKIEMKIATPSAEAVANQQTLTHSLQQDSRFGEIRALNEENKELEQRLLQLQHQQQTDVAALQQRTYRVNDHTIATREHGLFERINQLRASYSQQTQQIQQIQQTMEQNRQRLSTLQQQP